MKKLVLIFIFFLLQYSYTQNDTITIFYNIGTYKLTNNNRLEIEKELDKLDNKTKYHVQIISSCDYLGSNKNNLVLSSKRAEIVRDLLLKKENLIISSIKYKGIGEISSDRSSKKGIKSHRKTCIIIKSETQHVIDNIAVSKKGAVFVLRNIVFDPGRHFIKKESIPVLKKILLMLQENPKIEIEIGGHVCCGKSIKDSLDGLDNDTRTYNLSQNRAKHIYNYLIRKKIDSSRLTYKGYGFLHPLIYPELTKKDKSKNRRVEIKVLNN